jgi:hypothetical protein
VPDRDYDDHAGDKQGRNVDEHGSSPYVARSSCRTMPEATPFSCGAS